MCVHPLSAASVANVPTHPDIEAARRAWLATCHALARHIDPEAEPAPCAACQVYEGCEAWAALADDEERAFQELERTKGGPNGYR